MSTSTSTSTAHPASSRTQAHAPASYSAGHHPTVLNSHAQRTATNSALYLLPHINALSATQPRIRILDVGCGPGSITVDLAARYPQAEVIGLEPAEGASALDAARELAMERGLANVRFVVGDIHSLVEKLDEGVGKAKASMGKASVGKKMGSEVVGEGKEGDGEGEKGEEDGEKGEGEEGKGEKQQATKEDAETPTRFTPGSFDVVHAHQVLQHCGDPVSALRQMRRVCRSGGCVAVRTADLGTVSYHPQTNVSVGESTPTDYRDRASIDTKGDNLPAAVYVHPIKEWQRLLLAVIFTQGGEPRAGRMQHAWARAAGFDPKKIVKTWGTQSWGEGPDQVQAEAARHADRLLNSGFADSAVRHGLATRERLEKVAEGTRQWGKGEDAWLGILNGEMVCFV